MSRSSDQAPGPRNARTSANAAYTTSSSYPKANFLFSFVFEKIVVAIISRTKSTATGCVRNPRTRAIPPKNSRRLKRIANAAPPGHPVPFTNPTGFFRSLTFGQPCAMKSRPSATRPTIAATFRSMGKSIDRSLGRHHIDGSRRTFPMGEARGRRQRALERTLEELCDVESTDVLAASRFRGVVQHDEAVRARGRDAIRPGLLDMAQPAMVDLLPDPFLHPHSSPAGAAAESAVAASLHLHDADPRDPIQDVARLVVHFVVPAQIARIVVGQVLQHIFRRGESACIDEFLEKLRVVDDLVVPAEIRVLVLDRVEAVRARRDDPPHAIAVQGLDVRLDHRLCEVLISEAPRRIAGALLLGSQYGEPDAGSLQESDEGLGHLPVAVVERSGAPDPV